jgi:hypothetical protein
MFFIISNVIFVFRDKTSAFMVLNSKGKDSNIAAAQT